MTKNKFPEGWDEGHVRHVVEHYESQSDEEAVAEDEAGLRSKTSRRGPSGRRASN